MLLKYLYIESALFNPSTLFVVSSVYKLALLLVVPFPEAVELLAHLLVQRL
jgi:hypothetical protein